MLFRKTLRRELISLAGTIFATLLVITLTVSMVRILGRAAGGKEAGEIVLPLIAFQSLGFLPILLTLTVYVAVLSALTRAFRDAEMAVWFASGQSLLAWVRPVLSISVPASAIVALFSLWVAPWSQAQIDQFRHQAEQQAEEKKVAPGMFRESSQADRVFFVEGLDDEEQRVGTVFVASWQGARLSVVIAGTGAIETDPLNDRYAILERGFRYDGVPGQGAWRELGFGRYRLRLDEVADRGVAHDNVRALETPNLWQVSDRVRLGELAWRLAQPVSCIVLSLLAIPLASVHVRAGRSVNLFFALLVYVIYSNLLSLTQAYIAQGKAAFVWAFWPVHGLVIALTVLLFYRRITLRRTWATKLRSWWRQARSGDAT